jgi:WD40 repeat protein
METYLGDNDMNPKNIKLIKEITNNSFSDWIFENTFIVFKTINNFYLLIYATELKSIIIYDLNNFKIITEIKNSHEECITNFRHCYDKNIKTDLIMSVSRNNNNIKIWEIKYFQCLLNIKEVNTDGLLNSVHF